MVFLDTGYHFAETIGTRDAVEATLPVNLINDHARCRRVAEQDATYGKDLYKTRPRPVLRAAQGASRSSEALAGYDAWATGLRRDETHNRVIAPSSAGTTRSGKVKVSPLARWTDEEVERYIAENGVLVNPLQYDGYPSIGCCAVHPPGRPGRGPAQRPLGRHQQDRVRHPPVTHPIASDHVATARRQHTRKEAEMAAPALVALAHGSRDPRSAATIKALVDEVRAMRPDLRDRGGVPRALQAGLRTRSSTGWSRPATTRSSSYRCC